MYMYILHSYVFKYTLVAATADKIFKRWCHLHIQLECCNHPAPIALPT